MYALQCHVLIIEYIEERVLERLVTVNPIDGLDAADSKEQSLSTKLTEDLDCVDPKRFKLYHVDMDCELGYFIAECDLPYRVGSVYYEFFREEEDITEDKEIILMDNNVW